MKEMIRSIGTAYRNIDLKVYDVFTHTDDFRADLASFVD
jgi:hypothetical protein